jgi:hypothetical protein
MLNPAESTISMDSTQYVASHNNIPGDEFVKVSLFIGDLV